MMLGWECPKCARCYAPSVTMCEACPPRLGFTITIPAAPTCGLCGQEHGSGVQCPYIGGVGAPITSGYFVTGLSVGPLGAGVAPLSVGAAVSDNLARYGDGWPQ